MIEFPGNEPPGHEFDSRDDYLVQRTRSSDPDGGQRPIEPHGLSLIDTIPRGPVGSPKDQMDWLTLVLGSGCPSITDHVTREYLRALLHALRRADDHRGTDDDHTPDDVQMVVPGFDGSRRDFAAQFLEELIRFRSADRLGDIEVPGGADAVDTGQRISPELEPPTVERLEAALVVTRLITTLYHAVRHLQGLPFDEDSPVSFTSDGRHREIDRMYLQPLRAEMVGVREELESWIPDLPQRLESDRPVLSAEDVLRVTDWCWTKCLPSDVMPLTWDGVVSLLTPARPEVDKSFDRALPKEFMDRLNASVDTTIRLYAEQGHGDDARFLLGVAEVLVRQANRRSGSQKLYRPPAAVAFTTTPSMELEVALVSLRSDMVVVVPVLVREIRTGLVRLCWIAGVVSVGGGEIVGEDSDRADTNATVYELLKRPRQFHVVSNLRSLDQIRTVAGSRARARERKLADLPVVVHLSGCPFVVLPALENGDRVTEEIRQAMALQDGSRIRISHAMIDDEFLALQQSATESFFYPSTTGETKHAYTVGLPRSFTSADSPIFARYWMLCGVQFSDVSTRLRLTPRLPRRPTDALPAKPLPIGPATERDGHGTIGGLAINRSLGAGERNLLCWSGFDVVAADVADFSGDLEIYAGYLAHLEGQ